MSLEKVTQVRELIEQAQETMPGGRLPDKVERALRNAAYELRRAAPYIEDAEFALCEERRKRYQQVARAPRERE